MDRPRIFLSFFLGVLTLQLQVSALNPEADNGYEEWESLRNYSEFQRQSDGLRAAGDYQAVVLTTALTNCDSNYKSYAVNYIGSKTGIKNPIYEGCYDVLSQSAKWSRGELVPKSNNVKIEKLDEFYADDWMSITKKDLDDSYKKVNAKVSFGRRFPDLVGKPIECAQLFRGHLTPFGDMSTKIYADATNRFINVAPQWGDFNNGNWGKVEANIRNWNQQLNTPTPPPKSPPKPPISFTITTGTSKPILLDGILDGKEYFNKPFYLGNQDIIQVPLFFWKLICYPDNQKKKDMFIFGINFLFDEDLLSSKLFSNSLKRPLVGFTYENVKKIVCTTPIGYNADSTPVILPATADEELKGIVFGCKRDDILDLEIKGHTC